MCFLIVPAVFVSEVVISTPFFSIPINYGYLFYIIWTGKALIQSRIGASVIGLMGGFSKVH
jgi:hypothetical protein